MSSKIYKIERRMISIRTGWFKKEVKPMWCLVEYGKTNHSYFDPVWGTEEKSFDYNKVVLSSEDLEYIKEEYKNFSGSFLEGNFYEFTDK